MGAYDPRIIRVVTTGCDKALVERSLDVSRYRLEKATLRKVRDIRILSPLAWLISRETFPVFVPAAV
jgi:hypothetical protein